MQLDVIFYYKVSTQIYIEIKDILKRLEISIC